MKALVGRVSSFLIGLAAAFVIVTGSVLPFLTPQWVAFEQGRANATAWTGYTAEGLKVATHSILSDLVFGPPNFAGEVRGEPVLDERERGHMRDVRSVFVGLWVLAAVSIGVLVAARWRRDRCATWRAVRGGALGLTAGIVGIGAIALVAFDALFELFHRLFFPAGSYAFDPATERLVQLFPFQFWQESALAVGVVVVVVSVGISVMAGRRGSRRAEPVVRPELAATPEPS